MKYPSKLRPTRRIPAGECPCGALAVGSMWEADLGLCYVHVKDWLSSPEKKSIMVMDPAATAPDGATGGLVAIDDQSILRAVDAFVERVRKRSSWERLRDVAGFYWELIYYRFFFPSRRKP